MKINKNAFWLSNKGLTLVTLFILICMIAITIWIFVSGKATRGDVPTIDFLSGTILILVGLAAGFLGGLIGTGGCSIILPAIHFWLGYSAPVAIGTTLFAVIFTAISGGYAHFARRNLDTGATLLLSGTGIIGVLIGSWFFNLLLPHILLFGLILGLAFLLPAIRMIYEGFKRSKLSDSEDARIKGKRWGLAVFGLVIGVLTGIVGLGGGYALVPGLIYLFGLPVYITMGTSLATMIPLAVVGGGIKLFQGYVALGAGLLLATGTIIGAQIGAATIKRFKPNVLKMIFGFYFLYVSLKFITGFFGIKIW